MKTAKLLLVMLFSIVVAACGGGGGGGGRTTPDTTPPTVSSVSPANSAPGVGVNSVVTATFSEPMAASTVNTTTFTLSGGVTGVVTNSGTTATFTPANGLAYNTTYTAAITTGVTDAAGNAMASPYPWTFTTGIAPSGAIDPSFNTTGKVITSFGTNDDMANAVAVQTDGKIVVAGTSSNDFVLARYNTDGSLDTTFDTDGKVTTFIIGASSVDIARAVVIQTNGKIVAVGNADGNFALVRYNTNGSLDTTFGAGGKVTTSISGSTANAVAIQTDGKIVVAGNWGSNTSGFVLARYNTDGSLDATFDADGIVITTSFDMYGGTGFSANAVAIQTDGKIVAAGTGGFGSIGLVRYNTNGSLDTTFDTDGIVITSVPYATPVANTILIQSDGKIVAAGDIPVSGMSDNKFGLFRYNTDGSLETIFEKITTGTNDVLMAAALQTDGKIVAVGYTRKYISVNGDFVLRRYNTDGSFDATFGTGGKVVTPTVASYSSYAPYDGGHAVAIQADGKIVAAGSASQDFVVVRYWP